MIKNIAFCLMIFIVGIWTGMLNGTVVEVEKEVKVRVPFFDFTKMECQLKKEPEKVCDCVKCRLEFVGNFLGESVLDLEKIKETKKEIWTLHEDKSKEITELHEKHREEITNQH